MTRSQYQIEMIDFPYKLASALGTPFRWLFGIVRSTIHGDARWMSRGEQRHIFWRHNRGLVLSPSHRMSLDDSFANLVLVAPTGSGKTTRFVIPNVLEATGSVVVTDPSGEIYERTSGHLERRGFRIQTLRPADLGRSLRFNPMHRCRTPQQLRQLATILGNNGSAPGSDPFWTTTAVNVLYLVLAGLANVEDYRHRNLANLRWILNHMGGANSRGVHWFFSKHLKDEQLFSEYLAFCAQDPKVSASILASARAGLELWSDPDVSRLTACDTISIDSLRRQRTAIYLIVPEHRVRYFSLVLNLFYSACFSLCLEDGVGDEAIPVFFFLDEFGNLGKIDDFASVITTLRKRGCSISIILQELSQLHAIYGQHDARTIFGGGCASKLFFSGLDLETSRYIEGILGTNTEYDSTFGGIDEHARTIGVPLMRSDRVRMLKPSDAVLISGRQRPAKLKAPPYFRVPAWSRWSNRGAAEDKAPAPAEDVNLISLDESYRLTAL